MKLHKVTCYAIIEALNEIFKQGKYTDKVLDNCFKQNKKFGSRDRKFIAESVYEIVRWKRLLCAQGEISELKSNKDFWNLFAVYLVQKGVSLPEWEEFNSAPSLLITDDFNRKTKESVPDWLDELGESELGKSWDKELHALNQTADVVLRVNTLKTSKEKLIQAFQKKDIKLTPIDGYPDALILEQRQNLFVTPEYKEGWFEVQDASSQLIADYLQLEPNNFVIDACAGAGGKSLHIAARLNNTGKIISLDVEQNKLIELEKRAKRASVRNLSTRFIEDQNTINKLNQKADRVLLDVPCSGLGVLKRNPDAKWKLSPEFISKIKTTQQEILSEYSKMLKPNGILVYSTCSILPSENGKQIETFLSNNPNFKLLEEKSILPSSGFDGFYVAKLQLEK